MSIDLLPLNLSPALVSSSDAATVGSARPISIKSKSLKKWRPPSDRQDEMDSLPKPNHLSQMMKERETSEMIPNGLSKPKGGHSITSILDKFDDHFFRTYPWYGRAVAFRKSGFGFLFRDHHGADKILKTTHFINGKPESIQRILFVGGLPENTRADYFKEFFSKYGEVEYHEIVREYIITRRADFGFIVYNSAATVDKLLEMGKIDFYGGEVVLDKARLFRDHDECPSDPSGIEFDDFPNGMFDTCLMGRKRKLDFWTCMEEQGPEAVSRASDFLPCGFRMGGDGRILLDEKWEAPEVSWEWD